MEIPICKQCERQYDKGKHKPRVLGKCGHTICQKCLISSRKFRCPYDQLVYNFRGVKRYPVNVFILKMIKENVRYCEEHVKPLEFVCLDDCRKICSNCGLFGDHKNHQIIPQAELKTRNKEQIAALSSELTKFESMKLKKGEDSIKQLMQREIF